jgi:hypothetical protein
MAPQANSRSNKSGRKPSRRAPPKSDRLNDPVISYAREIERLSLMYIDLDRLESTVKMDPRLQQSETRLRIGAREQRQHTEDHISALEESATHVQARSLPGALFHVFLLDRVFAKLEEAEFDSPEAQEARRQARRLWHSIVFVLSDHVDESYSSLGRYYKPADSPWNDVLVQAKQLARASDVKGAAQ